MTDSELQQLVLALREQIASENAQTRQHFESTTERFSEENRRHFDISQESVRDTIRMVAEGVTQISETLNREVGRLDSKIDRGFAETQSMIRFSHAELERRVRVLEETFVALQLRLERLESTH
jgi:hypothetical protein